MLKFTLIGDGIIAKYHRKAIEHVGGEIVLIIDPKYDVEFPQNTYSHSHKFRLIFNDTDYFVICSPSNFHYQQLKYLLTHLNATWKPFQIICEKPAFLPWQPIIDDSKINIVLQLRYLPDLPEKAEAIIAHFVRDEEYFLHWQGNPRKSGGLFFHLFIHYIDLAIQLKAEFKGSINCRNTQQRKIYYGGFALEKIDLEKIDMQSCYNRMYEAILEGKGIKPKDIFYLMWILQRNSEFFGYGRDGIGKTIKIGNELL